MPVRDTQEYAESYFRRHSFGGTFARVRTWLERRALLRALEIAGFPDSIVDIPCGAGRFWPTLVRWCAGPITAMDISSSMINVALREASAGVRKRVKATTSSVFDIQLPDKSVESAISLRFFHHLARRRERLAALSELRRVALDTVIVSIWTDGNLSAWINRAQPRQNLLIKGKGYGRRVRLPRSMFEWEARCLALDVVAHVDVIPFVAKWRMYVLGVRPSTTRFPANAE